MANKAALSVETIKRLEKPPGKISAYTGTAEAIQRALERAGVEFTNGAAPGVRLKPTKRKR